MKGLRQRSLDIAVLGVFCVLTVVMTWPLVTQMSTHLAGDAHDVWNKMWPTWWTKKVISEELDFYYTDYLFYPRGTKLTFHSFSHTNTVLALALEPLTDPITAYNVTILLAYGLSGFTMYLLSLYLTHNRLASFVGGVVFAFFPYHIDQASHQIFVTTQWLPLFTLCLIRSIKEKSRKFAIGTAFFLAVNALTNWHLLIFCMALACGYLTYSLICERQYWDRRTIEVLIIMVAVSALLVGPPAYPLVREYVTSRGDWMMLSIKKDKATEILAFFVPQWWHPWLGKLFSEVYPITGRHQLGLGITSLAIAIYSLFRRRRRTIFWAAITLIAMVLTLGKHILIGGHILKAVLLPWSVPFLKLMRAPHRAMVITNLGLSVLVAWGTVDLMKRLENKQRWWRYGLSGLIIVLILFEYLPVPFPTSELPDPNFYREVAQDSEHYALVDLPLGDSELARLSMYYQTIHNKPIVRGHIGRSPRNAHKFLQNNAWLGASDDEVEKSPFEWPDLSRQMGNLADKGIRYLVLHKHVGHHPTPHNLLKTWRDYLTVWPYYEDEWLLVYRTHFLPERDFTLTTELGAGLGIAQTKVNPTEVSQGGLLYPHIRWGAKSAPKRDLCVELVLVDEEGIVRQTETFSLVEGWSTSEWPKGAVGIGEYAFKVDPHLLNGEYTLKASLIDAETKQQVGEAVELETITFKTQPRVFEMPEPQHVISETFGQDISFLGYDLSRSNETLHLTLHWKAEHRVSDYYKFFVHLLTQDTSEIVAQVDWVPRDWAYPTNWWRAGEVVSEEVEIPLSEKPAGRYKLVLGMYIPDGGRLKTSEGEDHIVIDREMILP
jgi:hypothetical protein